MNPRIPFLTLFLSVSLLAPGNVLSQGGGKAENRGDRGIRVEENKARVGRPPASPKGYAFALLIGNNAYAKTTRGVWPDLKTAVNDVEVLARVLMGRYGLREENLFLIRNGTREKIMSAFNRISDLAGPDDSVLIYYGGHGQYIKNRGYWVPVDGMTRANYISNADILATLGEIKARHKLLISDSCFSGKLFAKTRGRAPAQSSDFLTKSQFEELSELKSAQGLSSGGVQPVSDGGPQWDGHSIFAYHLIGRLRANRKPFLSASALGGIVGLQVANDTRNFMGEGGAQEPISLPLANQRHQGGEYFFIPTDVEVKTVPVILFLALNENPNFDPYSAKAVNAIREAMVRLISDNYLDVRAVKNIRGKVEPELQVQMASQKASTSLVLYLEGNREKKQSMIWQGIFSLEMKLRAFRYEGNTLHAAGVLDLKRQVLPVPKWSDEPGAVESDYEKIAKKMIRKWSVKELNIFLRTLN